jgi:hypothetical protein
MTKNWKKFTAEICKYVFLIKNCNLLIPRPPYRTLMLQEKPSTLKREHPALQNMKILYFLSILVAHFFPPESGSGSINSN